VDIEHILGLVATGFLVKSIASLDGTVAKIPVVSNLTENFLGKLKLP